MHRRSLVAAVLFVAANSSQAALLYGSNLVVNGDAEAGVTGWTGYAGYSLFQSVDYGGNWVQPTAPGPADRGSGMFAGVGQYTVGYQTLDFGSVSTGEVAYALSGWLGGRASLEDNALFYVQFLDEFDSEIGGATIGPVSAGDRAGQTGLAYRELDGFMPAGTRALSFWLSMEGVGAGANDGYADNLSFVLRAPQESEVPEPGIAATVLLGLGMLGWMRRRPPR
jgi:hypothetical protein